MKLPLRTVSVLICAVALCLGQSGASPLAPQASSPATEVPASPQPEAQTVPDNSGAAAAAADSLKAAAPQPAISNAPKSPGPAKSAAGVTPEAKPGSKPYIIGPLDVLDVNVWNDAHLSHIYDVSPDGTISMPLIGLVKADGLTQSELAAAISEKLLSVLNSPEVNIQVLKVNSKKYYVLGAVNRSGEFPLNGETTVLDALANVAGFHEFANQKKIRIIRQGVKPFIFNYKEVSKGKHMEQNIVLQNGDRIFVDE
jgi:polysaccharide export outer membrane protein